jgi:hypothetical protein
MKSQSQSMCRCRVDSSLVLDITLVCHAERSVAQWNNKIPYFARDDSAVKPTPSYLRKAANRLSRQLQGVD